MTTSIQHKRQELWLDIFRSNLNENCGNALTREAADRADAAVTLFDRKFGAELYRDRLVQCVEYDLKVRALRNV